MRARARTMRVAAAIIAATAGSATAAATATADTYVGPTSQGKKKMISVKTNADGAPTKANYEWDLRCKGGGSITNGATVSTRLRRSSPRRFSSGGPYKDQLGKRFTADYRVKISGDRVSDTRFTGSFKVKAKVFSKRKGDLITKCTSGKVRWRADLTDGPQPLPPESPAPRLR